MPFHAIPQPIVAELDAERAMDVLDVFASRLTQPEILASQVLDDDRKPGRLVLDHPSARDGRGRPLRIDLRQLRAFRERQGRDDFAPTDFGGSVAV